MLAEHELLKEYLDPVQLLQTLIQFDTTNPPGNETKCIQFIESLLRSVGIETQILGDCPERQNLVARLRGRGEGPAFLMYGHADVVTAAGQNWQYPPFSGQVAEGCVWGRGSLDMKGPLVMMILALIQAKLENLTPAGDIIFLVVSDEEGSGMGAQYIVDNYPELLDGVQYAIGEVGGFTLHLDQKTFYPIMVAEKQRSVIRMTIHGPGGHGAIPLRGGAMARLGQVLSKLDQNRLPVQVTPPVQMMIDSLAAEVSLPMKLIFKGLLKPWMTDQILDLLGERGKFFEPLLHNTVNATIVRGGNKINVIPGEITLEFDGRILPGYKPDDLIVQLQELLGDDLQFEVVEYDPGSEEVDMGFFNVLAEILREDIPEAIPIPFVVAGVTDGRFFSRLGIQTYGFTPMILPKGVDFSQLLHAANERIPVEALEYGVKAVYKLLQRL